MSELVGRVGFAVVKRGGGSRSASGARWTVEGYAKVRVLAVLGDGVCRVAVVAGCGVTAGIARELDRADLFFDRDELDYFERLVGFLCGEERNHPGPPLLVERRGID